MAETRSAETKETMKKGNASYVAARKRLIAAHQDEYNAILGEERVSRGLTRFPIQGDPTKLQARKERLEAQLAKLKGQLGETTQPT